MSNEEESRGVVLDPDARMGAGDGISRADAHVEAAGLSEGELRELFAAPAAMPEEARGVDPDDGTGPYYWLDDVPALLRLAGSPEEWVGDLSAIVGCETGREDRITKRMFVRAGAVGDDGASLGVAQLDWPTWFRAALGLGLVSESDFQSWGDVLVNLRGAVAARMARGRFGGGGGWSCADLRGIE